MTIQNWERRGNAAEKTVEVLKNKVREMYAGGSKTNVQRQLGKAKEREERNRQRRALMELKAAELEKYSKTLESEVTARTREIKTILDNVTFGFVLIDSEMRVMPGFTQSCATLIGSEIQVGQLLTDVLECDEARGDMFAVGVEQIFDDIFPEELSTFQLESRFTPGDAILNLDARAVRNGEDEVIALLCSLSDIKALEAAENASRTAEILIGILSQKEAFDNFVHETKVHLESAKSAAFGGEHTYVKRAVHTVKGNAASYGLADVVSTVHAIEEKGDIGVTDIEEIEASLIAFLAEHNTVLGLDYQIEAEEHFTLSHQQVRELEGLLAHVDNPGIASWLVQLRQKTVRDIVGPVDSYIRKLSERLEKSVNFVFEGDQVFVDSQIMAPVLGNLSHILRNAVDHGLEQPSDRGDKPESCNLGLFIKEDDIGWTIEVSDDGRGIDTSKLGAKAIDSGVITAAEFESMNNDERHQLVFLDGISSSDTATELSGRGVGMSAVLGAVQEHGGQVSVRSEKGVGTTFKIFIPQRLVKQVAA